VGTEQYKGLVKKFKKLSARQWQLQKKERILASTGKQLSVNEKQEFESNLTVLRSLKKSIQKVSLSI